MFTPRELCTALKVLTNIEYELQEITGEGMYRDIVKSLTPKVLLVSTAQMELLKIHGNFKEFNSVLYKDNIVALSGKVDADVLEIAATILGMTIDEEFKRTYREKELQSIINTVKEAKVKFLTDMKKTGEDRIKELTRQIENTRNNLQKLITDRIKEMLYKPEEEIEKINAKVDEDIARILKHKKVKTITFEDDRLCVHTIPLVMTEPNSGRLFHLGSMIIKIPLTTRMGIKFTNTDNVRNGYWQNSPHPHVESGGTPCLGNIESAIVSYITTCDLYPMFVMLLNYLETANIADSAGVYIASWDEVDAEGNILHEGKPREKFNKHGINIDDEPEDWMEECIFCGEHYEPEEMYECVHCGRFMCTDCRCIDPNDDYSCPRCYETMVVNCDHCDEPIFADEVFDFNGASLCEDCYDRARAEEEETFDDNEPDFEDDGEF